MMKTNKKRSAKSAGGIGRGLAERMAGHVLKGQRRLADRMNTRAGQMEPRLLKGILLAAGILFAGYCTWLLVTAFI